MTFWLCAILILGGVISGAAEPRAAGDYFTRYTAESFRQLVAAKRELLPDRYDTNLLSAAVFHETNRRRAAEKLPALHHNASVARAAAIQSELMRKAGKVRHENPDVPKYETLEARIKAVGLNPRFAAENVATAFGFHYESGKSFYPRRENGETTYSYTPNGKAIERHTYLSFARELVDQWMASPGHRKNILHPEARFLGVSCLPKKGGAGMPVFYCAQVFFTPLE